MGEFIQFYTELSAHPYFHFQMITCVNINGFSPNLVNAFILWRSGMGLLMDSLGLFLTELSAHHRVVVGYHHFTILLLYYI